MLAVVSAPGSALPAMELAAGTGGMGQQIVATSYDQTESTPYGGQYYDSQYTGSEESPWVLDYTVDGQPYWYNYDTGESSWYQPEEVDCG